MSGKINLNSNEGNTFETIQCKKLLITIKEEKEHEAYDYVIHTPV